MKKIKLLLAMLLLGCGVLGLNYGVLDASADEIKNSLTVSPQHQRIMLVPGETYHGSIKVSSQASSTRATEFDVSVAPFSETAGEGSRDDYGMVNYVDRTTYNMIVDWIDFEQSTDSVEPNDAVTIPFTITVPDNAPAGGQYASIVVKDASPHVSQDGGVAVDSVMQILSIIYAEVAGETKDDGVVLENTMSSFLLNGPLIAESMVRNDGNVHTMAQYTLQVWPLFSDEEICTNEEEPETSLVLPETERYHAQTCELPSVGIFKAKQTVKIFGEESTVEKMVFICPIWLLFIIFFVIAAIIIWLVMQIQKRKRNAKQD